MGAGGSVILTNEETLLMEIDRLEIPSFKLFVGWKFGSTKVLSMKWFECRRELLSLEWKKVALLVDVATKFPVATLRESVSQRGWVRQAESPKPILFYGKFSGG
jgi:hypothetical protein